MNKKRKQEDGWLVEFLRSIGPFGRAVVLVLMLLFAFSLIVSITQSTLGSIVGGLAPH